MFISAIVQARAATLALPGAIRAMLLINLAISIFALTLLGLAVSLSAA